MLLNLWIFDANLQGLKNPSLTPATEIAQILTLKLIKKPDLGFNYRFSL